MCKGLRAIADEVQCANHRWGDHRCGNRGRGNHNGCPYRWGYLGGHNKHKDVRSDRIHAVLVPRKRLPRVLKTLSRTRGIYSSSTRIAIARSRLPNRGATVREWPNNLTRRCKDSEAQRRQEVLVDCVPSSWPSSAPAFLQFALSSQQSTRNVSLRRLGGTARGMDWPRRSVYRRKLGSCWGHESPSTAAYRATEYRG